ncbi:hypothetical protein [Desulfonatronum parangueonense]
MIWSVTLEEMVNEGTNFDHGQKVIKIAQELLLDEEDRTAINSDLISEKIDMVLGMFPKWSEGLNRELVVKELIRRCSHWISRDTRLVNETGDEA